MQTLRVPAVRRLRACLEVGTGAALREGMKLALLIGLALLPAVTHAQDIRSPNGNVLTGARVTGFDGQTFTVEHDGGIARMPFAQLPEARRPAGASFDPARAEQLRAQAARHEWLQRAPKIVLEGDVISAGPDGAVILPVLSQTLPAAADKEVNDLFVYVQPCADTNRWEKKQHVRLVGVEAGTNQHFTKTGNEMKIRSFLLVNPLSDGSSRRP